MADNTQKQNRKQTGSLTKLKLKEPSLYKVVMLNDDFTPMDFVVDILMHIFDKAQPDAVELMMKVHKEGQAVIAVYPYDVARTKQRTAIGMARAKGYPFNIRIDKE
ncbi:MAG: ATP-dependent Clp protease adaptor ClpS [Lachnospiraceae bacterium]|nr:ATP-dependent Clp protease adaptor ClpS [Lachnospiraceae bacterium]